MNKSELSARVAAPTYLSKQSAEGTGCLHDAVFPLAVTSITNPTNSYNPTTLSFPTDSPPKPTCTAPRDEGYQEVQSRFQRVDIRAKMHAVEDPPGPGSQRDEWLRSPRHMSPLRATTLESYRRRYLSAFGHCRLPTAGRRPYVFDEHPDDKDLFAGQLLPSHNLT